jgi:hypothetical protein
MLKYRIAEPTYKPRFCIRGRDNANGMGPGKGFRRRSQNI